MRRERLEELEMKHAKEMDELFEKLDRAVVALKFGI
jgi:hypothetical protein